MERRRLARLVLLVVLVSLPLMLPYPAMAWEDLSPAVLGDYGVTELGVGEISDGFSPSTWGPYRSMLRQHFAKMASEAFGLEPAVSAGDTQWFADVSPSHPFFPSIEAAARSGLVVGSYGRFNPADTITRQQATAILARWRARQAGVDLPTLYGPTKAAQILTRFVDSDAVGIRPEMAYAVQKGIVQGTGANYLNPTQQLTRIQGAAMLIRSGVALTELPPSQTLSDIDFVDEDYGWAVGSDGFMMHSQDGGDTWVRQFPPTADHVNAVYFFDRDEGLAATGPGGIVLHTADGGVTWNILDDGFLSLFELDFVDRSHGWMVDEAGGVLRTTDGAQTWATTRVDPLLNGVSFVDTLNGWIVGTNGYIGHSNDGGATWTQQRSGVNELYGIHMLDAAIGSAVGAGGTILRTFTGGSAWTHQFAPVVDYRDVVLSDALTGWAVGESGTILGTSDGGVNWTLQTPTPADADLYRIDIGGTSLWILGWSAENGTVILRSTDGTTWQERTPER